MVNEPLVFELSRFRLYTEIRNSTRQQKLVLAAMQRFIHNEALAQAAAAQAELQNAGEIQNKQSDANGIANPAQDTAAQVSTNGQDSSRSAQTIAHAPAGSVSVSTSGEQMGGDVYIRAFFNNVELNRNRIMGLMQFSLQILVNQ